MEFKSVTKIDGNEFGFFESNSDFKVMVFNDAFKKQQIISYEESHGEAMESIERTIKEGFDYWGWEFEGRENFKL